MNKLKISQVQFQASHTPVLNAETLEKSFNNTLKYKPHLICTPECSNIITNDKKIFNIKCTLSKHLSSFEDGKRFRQKK